MNHLLLAMAASFWILLLPAAPALTTTTVPVITTGEQTASTYDASSAPVVSNGAFTVSRTTCQPASFFGPIAGFVAAKSGLTSMYRAVSKAELDDIAARGFQLKPGGYESKLFATSAEDAAAFGRDLYKLDRVPFHLVETKVPNSVFNQFERMPLDFKPAVNVPGPILPQLNSSMTWNELLAIPVGR